MKTRTALISAGLASLAVLTGCSSDADVASENLSNAADNFEVERRIIFINGITDQYLLEIQGRCAIADEGSQLEVTCKIGPNEYKKHFLGLSDNVTYVAEQLQPIDVDVYTYRVNFRPEAIIPDINTQTSGDDGN